MSRRFPVARWARAVRSWRGDRLVRRGLGFLLRPFQFSLFLLGGRFPRDPHTWAFGTWSGTRFADNSAAVFRYLNDDVGCDEGDLRRHGIRTVWITRRVQIRDELRARGMRAHLAWSPAGIWWGLRAGVYVYDSMPIDINFWLSHGARLVLLQHGSGMKKIERAIDNPDHRLFKLFHGNLAQKFIWRVALPWHLAVPDLVAACSPDHARQALTFFPIDEDVVKVTGLPRHDRFVDADAPTRTGIPTVGGEIPTGRPVFLYLPTFREGVGRRGFDWAVLQDAAAAADVTIAVKLHVVDAERGVRGLAEIDMSDNLRIVQSTIDPVDVYGRADGLITDYSSVAYDVLLLDRPVIHYVPDLDEFVTSRPLVGRFEDLAVGPICRTGDELADALRASADPDNEEMTEQRRRVRERAFTYPPGGARKRVVDAIRAMTGSDTSAGLPVSDG